MREADKTQANSGKHILVVHNSEIVAGLSTMKYWVQITKPSGRTSQDLDAWWQVPFWRLGAMWKRATPMFSHPQKCGDIILRETFGNDNVSEIAYRAPWILPLRKRQPCLPFQLSAPSS